MAWKQGFIYIYIDKEIKEIYFLIRLFNKRERAIPVDNGNDAIIS